MDGYLLLIVIDWIQIRLGYNISRTVVVCFYPRMDESRSYIVENTLLSAVSTGTAQSPV